MRRRFSWFAFAAAIAGAAGISGCTSTQTSTGVTAPSSQKCQIQVTNSPSTFNDAGGAGSLSIATTRDCSWSVTSNANWVSIPTSSASGQGDASIAYSVAANTIPQIRSAALAVEGQTVQLTQAAAPCRYSLNKTSDLAPYTGGALSVTLTTLSGCGWSTSSDVGWLAVSSNANGSASAVVGFTIGPNTGPQRTGHALIAGLGYTVTQDAAPASAPSPAPAPSPSPAPAPSPAPSPEPVPMPVQESGTVSGLSGRCPAIGFVLNGESVSADSATTYSGGHCGDVKNGVHVTVSGTESNATITATAIQISK
jgi:hypothetical protein